MRKINTNKIRFNKFILLFIFLFFIIVIARTGFLSISPVIDGINIKNFVSNRNTRKKTIYAKRGTIYDVNGTMLANTVNSYVVIAYLSESRSNGYKTPQHVVDKEMTAKKLSPIIGMSEEAILYLLNRNAYQVELGPGGRDISEIKKDEIKELNLPGISFISSYKRYYPYNDFASYILGYVKSTDDGELVGEMGIEMYYNDMLKGIDGYTIYQQDVNGYKIPNTNEEIKESSNGVNVYLTIDKDIQYFAEKYTSEAYKTYNPDWLITNVMDARTGAILASTSYPSFDPNIKNMTNYLNPLVAFAYEPGSTMKIFTYISAMEKGVYDGTKKYLSGSKKIGNDYIYDWKRDGFGEITYDEGFMLSSNVAAYNLVEDNFTALELKEYFTKYGFGKKTGIELPGELPGNLEFKYDLEIANASFGQGITVTPVQMLQGMTIVANKGVMLKPYIVDKIVNSNTNEILYRGTRTELGKVTSEETTQRLIDLMHKVIYNDLENSIGYGYKMDGYGLVGKTGTAQYVNTNTGKYYLDDTNYIRSFIGLFPKDDPEIIIYVAMKKNITQRGIQDIVKGLVKDISNYKGLYNENINNEANSYILDNYINKSLDRTTELKSKYKDIIILGNGNKIINQYPKGGTNVSTSEKIYLLTDANEINMPNIIGWSLKEVDILSKLLSLKYTYEGSGYVYEQSIVEGSLITDDVLNVMLKNKVSN